MPNKYASGGSGRRKRRHRAEHGADSHDDGALAENEPQHVTVGRAERHADADLLRPPHDRVGDDAVQADRGQPDGAQACYAQHRGEKACRKQLGRHVVAQRKALQEDHVRIDLPQLSLHRRAKRARIGLGAREQHRSGQQVGAVLGRRVVDVRRGLLVQKAHLVVAGDADNLEDILATELRGALHHPRQVAEHSPSVEVESDGDPPRPVLDVRSAADALRIAHRGRGPRRGMCAGRSRRHR